MVSSPTQTYPAAPWTRGRGLQQASRPGQEAQADSAPVPDGEWSWHLTFGFCEQVEMTATQVTETEPWGVSTEGLRRHIMSPVSVSRRVFQPQHQDTF